MAGIVSSNQGKYNDFQIIEGHKELMFTPQDTVIKIMDWVLPQVMIDDVLFDGFKGEGSFLYQFPDNMVSDYCEIDEGLDFFKYNKKVDWAISNPPFRVLENGEPINAFIPIINHTMQICNKGFFYLINHKLWSSLTVKRLKEWKEKGWVISAIMVLEIKKWYGRYYVVKFEKNGKSIMVF